MSRVRWAVRYKHGKVGAYRYGYRMAANNEAVDSGGKVVRVTQYDAAETAARRAVIEAAKTMFSYERAEVGPWARDRLRSALDALEAIERKAVTK